MVKAGNTCPLCGKKGVVKELVAYQISLEDAIYLCSDAECLYPLGVPHVIDKNLVKRNASDVITRMRKSRHSNSSTPVLSPGSTPVASPQLSPGAPHAEVVHSEVSPGFKLRSPPPVSRTVCDYTLLKKAPFPSLPAVLGERKQCIGSSTAVPYPGNDCLKDTLSSANARSHASDAIPCLTMSRGNSSVASSLNNTCDSSIITDANDSGVIQNVNSSLGDAKDAKNIQTFVLNPHKAPLSGFHNFRGCDNNFSTSIAAKNITKNAGHCDATVEELSLKHVSLENSSLVLHNSQDSVRHLDEHTAGRWDLGSLSHPAGMSAVPVKSMLQSPVKQQRPKTEVVSADFTHCFLQWTNKDALCWLDVTMTFLVYCSSLGSLLDVAHFSHTLLKELLHSFRKAQNINRQALEFRHCARLARHGRLMSILTSIGKITVKTGGGACPATDDTTVSATGRKQPDVVVSSVTGSGEQPAVGGERLGQKEWLMTPGELEARAAALVGRAEGLLDDVRETVWQKLYTKLHCNKGSNDSPVFALPLLLKECAAFEEHFCVTYEWHMVCDQCGYQHIDAQQKTLPSFPRVEKDFSMGAPYFRRACFRCHAPGQTMAMRVRAWPLALLAHFVDGLHAADMRAYDFTHGHHGYEVKAVVQYVSNPDHFICWVRRRQAGKDLWMELNDLNKSQCEFSEKQPKFPASQIHMVLWERMLTGDDNRTSVDIGPAVQPTTDVTGRTDNHVCGADTVSAQNSGSCEGFELATASAGSVDAIPLTPTETIVVQATSDGRQTVIDLRNAVKPTGRRQVIKLLVKRKKEDTANERATAQPADYTLPVTPAEESSDFNKQGRCSNNITSIPDEREVTNTSIRSCLRANDGSLACNISQQAPHFSDGANTCGTPTVAADGVAENAWVSHHHVGHPPLPVTHVSMVTTPPCMNAICRPGDVGLVDRKALPGEYLAMDTNKEVLAASRTALQEIDGSVVQVPEPLHEVGIVKDSRQLSSSPTSMSFAHSDFTSIHTNEFMEHFPVASKPDSLCTSVIENQQNEIEKRHTSEVHTDVAQQPVEFDPLSGIQSFTELLRKELEVVVPVSDARLGHFQEKQAHFSPLTECNGGENCVISNVVSEEKGHVSLNESCDSDVFDLESYLRHEPKSKRKLNKQAEKKVEDLSLTSLTSWVLPETVKKTTKRRQAQSGRHRKCSTSSRCVADGKVVQQTKAVEYGGDIGEQSPSLGEESLKRKQALCDVSSAKVMRIDDVLVRPLSVETGPFSEGLPEGRLCETVKKIDSVDEILASKNIQQFPDIANSTPATNKEQLTGPPVNRRQGDVSGSNDAPRWRNNEKQAKSALAGASPQALLRCGKPVVFNYKQLLESLKSKQLSDRDQLEALREKLCKPSTVTSAPKKKVELGFGGMPLKNQQSALKNNACEKKNFSAFRLNTITKASSPSQTRKLQQFESYCPRGLKAKMSKNPTRRKNGGIANLCISPRKKSPKKGKKISFAEGPATVLRANNSQFNAARNLSDFGGSKYNPGNEANGHRGRMVVNSQDSGINASLPTTGSGYTNGHRGGVVVNGQDIGINTSLPMTGSGYTNGLSGFSYCNGENTHDSVTSVSSESARVTTISDVIASSLDELYEDKVMAAMGELCEKLDIPSVPLPGECGQSPSKGTILSVKDSPGAALRAQGGSFDLAAFLFDG